jgi:protein-tyrosine phosphatase
MEIIPHLYLASFEQAKCFSSPTHHPLFVVNCTKDLPMLRKEGSRVPVDDNGTHESITTMLHYFPEITVVIHNNITVGQDVLVYCLAGQQRSAAVVCAYLVAYTNRTLDEAVELIQKNKRDAFFWQVNFREALERWFDEV